MYSIKKLTTMFKDMDKNNNNTIDRNEFLWGLSEQGLKFPKTDVDNIFRYFDKN